MNEQDKFKKDVDIAIAVLYKMAKLAKKDDIPDSYEVYRRAWSYLSIDRRDM